MNRLEHGRLDTPECRTHTVYPVKHMVVVGGLTTGFAFYGPFDTAERATAWAFNNLKSPSPYCVSPMFDVRDNQ